MEKSNKVYLEDIVEAIQLIVQEYVVGMSFGEFKKDKKTQDAVIRQIAIIGEAMGKLDKDYIESHPELPGEEAVAMRNVLVHDYDWVDTEEVWRTVGEDLPKLKEAVEKIMREEEQLPLPIIPTKHRISSDRNSSGIVVLPQGVPLKSILRGKLE